MTFNLIGTYSTNIENGLCGCGDEREPGEAYCRACKKVYEGQQMDSGEKEVEGAVLPTWDRSLREVHGNFRLGFCPPFEKTLHRDRRRANGRSAPMPALSRED